MSRRVILFGAGEGGRNAFSWLGPEDEVVAIVDNDAAKHGHCLFGHRIEPPTAINQMTFDVILVASMYFEEIAAELRQADIAEERIERALPSKPSECKPVRCLGDYRPLVSVIMPAYNRAAVVGRAVRSVLAQQYARLELLLIDDGSADQTKTVALDAAAGDTRLHVISREHRGVSAARNAGLSSASGELIAYLDTDNRWHEEYLSRMLAYFATGEYAVGYSASNVFDNERGLCYLRHSPFDRVRLAKRNFIDLNVFMHHKSLMDSCGLFDEAMTRLVDWDLVLRYTANCTPFVIGAALVDYYVEPGLKRISGNESFDANYQIMMKRSSVTVASSAAAGACLS